MIRVLCIAIGLLIGACQTFTYPPEAVNPAAAKSPRDAVQSSINASLSTVLALGETVRADADAGLVSVAEANADLEKLSAIKGHLDTAQRDLDAGNLGSAKTQQDIAAKLVSAARIGIANRARRGE